MKEGEAMNKWNEVKGTVAEVKNNAARVVFPNGDTKWFTLDTKHDHEWFALGKELSFRQYTMPKNRAELFERLETFPVKIDHFVAAWEEGTTKRKGKLLAKTAVGAGIKLANVEVFGTPNGKYFFVGDGKNVSRHHYAKPLEVEHALIRRDFQP